MPEETNTGLRLSRRERQILDTVFRLGRATAAEIQSALPDPPSYSAVRTHLRLLEGKGHIAHAAEELRYVYFPAIPAKKARRSAMRHLIDTFFGGSPGSAAATLLDESAAELSPEELDRLSLLIEKARKDGR